jgi:hypothetical protein
MASMLRWMGCSTLLCSTVACGTADGDSASTVEGGETVVPAPVDAPLEKVRQSLGEATCASTPADHVFDPALEDYVQSPTNTYDHPTCRNGYVIDLQNAGAGHTLNGSMFVQPSDPFTCLFNWSYIALYQKQGTSYVKIGENIAGGGWGLGPFGGACSAIAKLTTPAAGDYKVVVSAGNLFGGRNYVRFLYQ